MHTRDTRRSNAPIAATARGLLWRDGLSIVYAPDGTSFRRMGAAPDDALPSGEGRPVQNDGDVQPIVRSARPEVEPS